MSRSFGETSLTTRIADQDLAVTDLLEPGDHPQRRRLAAAGRADEHHELAVADLELEIGRRRACRRAKVFETSWNSICAIVCRPNP